MVISGGIRSQISEEEEKKKLKPEEEEKSENGVELVVKIMRIFTPKKFNI